MAITGAEEHGTQAYCPRCGFIPRVPRTTCPLCARALITDSPEGIDTGRSPTAPLVVLGVGLALATGTLLVVNAIDTDTDPVGVGAGVPRLVSPDSGVLGTTESGGDEKKDRGDGKGRDGERDKDGGDGDGGGDGEGDGDGSEGEAEAERPDAADDLASTPPLLPPIGSEEPDAGPPVPPLGDVPGMPPALAPVADVASDDSDGDGDGGDDGDSDDGGSDDGDSGGSTDEPTDSDAVGLASFDRGSSAYTVRLAAPQSRDGAEETARAALIELGTLDPPVESPVVGVLEIKEIPELEGDEGKWIPFCGRFEVEEEKAEEEVKAKLFHCLALSLDDDLVFVPALLAVLEDAEPGGGDPPGGNPAGLSVGIPESDTETIDPDGDNGPAGAPAEETGGGSDPDDGLQAGEETETESEGSSADEDAEEGAPADPEKPGSN